MVKFTISVIIDLTRILGGIIILSEIFEFKSVGKTTVTIDNGFIKIARRGLMNRLNNGRGEKNIRISSFRLRNQN